MRVKPYQNATAAGLGGAADYSKWNFGLASKYTIIKQGNNRITAKYEWVNNHASKGLFKREYYWSKAIAAINI